MKAPILAIVLILGISQAHAFFSLFEEEQPTGRPPRHEEEGMEVSGRREEQERVDEEGLYQQSLTQMKKEILQSIERLRQSIDKQMFRRHPPFGCDCGRRPFPYHSQ
ncbi:unnamed protein product [Mesocestoides corti]|uniref:SVM_signal domain-containing protein n=1 Tax=Mesocestoides corti TaxID=53468 RepID=A0A0R3U4H6_MESCO|nr:unnamed protein product [Mesocestoides corti]